MKPKSWDEVAREIVTRHEPRRDSKLLVEAIASALSSADREARMKSAELVDSYWKFDKNQRPLSDWHEKQACLEAIRNQQGGSRD